MVDIPAGLEHRCSLEAKQVHIPPVFPYIESSFSLVDFTSFLDGGDDTLPRNGTDRSPCRDTFSLGDCQQAGYDDSRLAD
jgi:hypothetical protein